MLSCKPATIPENKAVNETRVSEKSKDTLHGFRFSDFIIMKGQLGKIKIGMTIKEAEMQFSGLTKKVDEAGNFGYDGGGEAYLYYWGDTVIFGLIPYRDNDTLLAIIAVSKHLKTSNGLNPNSTVSELMTKYMDLIVHISLMDDWEYFSDDTNNYDFIFYTSEKTRIGKYPDPDASSEPFRVATKANWITIR